MYLPEWFHRKKSKKKGIPKDFSSKTFANPYFRYKTRPTFLHRRTKIALLILPIVLIVWGAILWFHPFFSIHTILFQGNTTITDLALQTTIERELRTKMLGLFPRDTYFLIRKEWIRKKITKAFALKSITIEKIFPDTLHITLEEKITHLIYQDPNNEQYALAMDGIITQKLGSEVLAGLPILQGTSLVEIGAMYCTKECIAPIIPIYEYLQTTTHLPIAYFRIRQNEQIIEAHTTAGWVIFMSPSGDISQQLQTIHTAYQKILKESPPKEYADVRFDAKIFYK